ncbi:MAG TPA: MBL fold metallo-hydrolase [Gaiellaceae bacterium]|nr:MBL fold metallo-hydrolase [Gaiellaceae bacterium]
MDVLRITPALWRWTAYHEEWRQDVGSTYCVTRDGVVLVDPLVPGEPNAKTFWKALDRDVEGANGVVHVLVTVFWHTRSAAEMVSRYDARVWAQTSGRAAIERRAGVVTDTFRPGDELPGGIQAFGTARRNEVVYWLARERAVVPGDVLLGGDAGAVRMCPESWLPKSTGHAELAESLAPLLDLPVERVLVSHGEPVLENGREALAVALGRT